MWFDILDCSFPALSCEFASVDVSDVLGTVSSLSLAVDAQSTFNYNAVGKYMVVMNLCSRILAADNWHLL